MQLAKSTYYFEIKKDDIVKQRNKEIEKLIRDVFEENKQRYGVRRIHKELINRGYKINHKRVQRIMKSEKLIAKAPKKKYRSYIGTVGKIADNIISRDFKATKPFQKWTTDVSQFSFTWGKCFLSPILDMHSNEIISYDLSIKPDMSQVNRMLDKAFERFPDTEGLVFHSDQGWQYQQTSYQEKLKNKGIIQSMSRKGNCYDNSIMETFFGRMKIEMYYNSEENFKSFEEFSRTVNEYIDYYNNKRIQKKTNWMPPSKYRAASLK